MSIMTVETLVEELIVTPDGAGPIHHGWLGWRGARFRCALGRGGIAADKREGDGKTPIGFWPCRRVFYRPDRIDPPVTALQVVAIDRDDGWCDAPDHPSYNRPIRFPFDASAEHLWRDDHLYDMVVELGYNDTPPVPDLGSAIFFHLAHDDFAATEGCVAIPADLMTDILRLLSNNACMRIVGED